MMKSRPDKQSSVSTLGEYVKRILEEKQLTMYDVEVRSERRIADAYVANVLNGVAKNLTVEKLKALAVGLGEPEDDVFKVARAAAGGRGRTKRRTVVGWRGYKGT